jgi:hypothetical protein
VSQSDDTTEGSSASKSYTPSESDQLRAVLFELLNSELASSDRTIRALAQARLMHIEQQIRRERFLYGDIETATCIGTRIVSDALRKTSNAEGAKTGREGDKKGREVVRVRRSQLIETEQKHSDSGNPDTMKAPPTCVFEPSFALSAHAEPLRLTAAWQSLQSSCHDERTRP